MGKIKNKDLMILVLSFFLALGLILWFTAKKFSFVNAVVNGVIFIIIGILFLKSFKRFQELDTFNEDINMATNTIENEDFESAKQLIDKYNKEPLFNDEELNRKFRLYLTDLKKESEYKNTVIQTDIEEYINFELIDNILKSNMLHYIPGALTGLGILGTFVGLAFGLNEFDISNSKTIETSINPLMEGIKVAFYTSIAGIFLSLVYNYVLNRIINNSDHILNNFIKVFKNKIKVTNQNDVINSLITNQNSQIENLNKINEDLNQKNNEIIQNQKEQLESSKQQINAINNMQKEFSNKVGKVLVEVLTPQLQQMSNVVEQFAKNATRDQSQALSKVVDNFVESMNNSLGDNFKNLGDSISNTVKLQEMTNENTKKMISHFNDASVEMIKKYEESTNNITTTYKESNTQLIDKLEESTKKLTTTYNDTNNQLIEKVEESTSSLVDKFSNASVNIIKDITTTKENITKVSQLVKESIEGVSYYINGLNTLQTTISESINEMDKRLEGNQTVLDKQNNYISELITYEKNISKASNKFTEDMVEQIKSINDLKKTLEEESLRSISQIVASTDNNNEKIFELVKKQLEAVIKTANAKTNDMNRATRLLDEAISHIDERMSGSLNNTFETFDIELSKITTHLSGTILNIQSETERVPEVVANSYDGIKKGFNELQKQLMILTKSIKDLNEKVNKLNTVEGER